MRRFVLFAYVVALAMALAGCGGSGSGSSTHEELLVGSSGNGKILRYNAATGAYLGVFAQGGPLVSPNGLGQLPTGEVVVGDFVNHKILLYSQKGAFERELGTLAGTPFDLLVLPNGDFLVSENFSPSPAPHPTGRVVKYTNGAFHTFIEGGPLNGPDGMAIGPDGNLYLSSQDSFQVLKYNVNTGALLGVVTEGDPLGTPNAGPSGLAFGPDGNLYVTQHDTNPVATTNGMVLRYNGTTGAFMDFIVPEHSGGISGPIGVGFTPSGNLLVTSAATNELLAYALNGVPAGVFATSPDLQGPIYFTKVRR
ncbi:hypothetical protein [Fimbriimonas ginsengisoli]|uniref:Putative lipoprotein n=1 Tax=Fimbriimonas ginsengisoli Gsoil 348 TaxID=661478 RepID=A0A068NXF3_FIMGI|nr:hypothetical protein [Fimbriimonas ginsengisoli]AIE86314.1 putative lipoprotein [Fimbriimonas ginsengisoli Gsoil 348]